MAALGLAEAGGLGPAPGAGATPGEVPGLPGHLGVGWGGVGWGGVGWGGRGLGIQNLEGLNPYFRIMTLAHVAKGC